MDKNTEAIEEACVRAEAYRMLASVFFKELDESQIGFLKEHELPAGDNDRMRSASAAIRRYFRLAAPDVLTRLRVDYARIFLAAGVYEGDTAVPFESVFTSEEGLMMQEARDAVLACYRSEKVLVEKSLRMPEDHLSFELEFLAILCDRVASAQEQGDAAEAARLEGVQARFLREHVLNWIGLLERRVGTFAEEGFYPAFVSYAIGFAEEDLRSLEARAA